MRYGNDDQARQSEIEEQHRIQQRRFQLALMSKRDLVALYRRRQRIKGTVTVFGGPVTKHDYIDAIECDERLARYQVAHTAQYGAGHERCPSVNFEFTCDVSRETESGDDDVRA